MLQLFTRVLCPTRLALALVTGAALLCTAPARGADLTAYTEEWAPYNYTEGGDIKGIATDLLRAMCQSARLQCDIHMVPWARAYRNATHTANTLVYTTARKPAREREFIWVGPILPRATWVFARQGIDKEIHSLSDLAHHRVGVVRNEASVQDLQTAGVPARALVLQATNADVLRLLLGASVDAMVDTEVGMQWNLRKAGAASDAVGKRIKLSDEGAYYFALHPGTDPALVHKLESALEKLRQDGRVDAIVRKYTAAPVGKP